VNARNPSRPLGAGERLVAGARRRRSFGDLKVTLRPNGDAGINCELPSMINVSAQPTGFAGRHGA